VGRTVTTAGKITWRQDRSIPDTHNAWSGSLQIGFVLKRSVDGVWIYQLNAVFTRWITKGSGEVSSMQAGKRALRRAWLTWCREAGLVE